MRSIAWLLVTVAVFCMPPAWAGLPESPPDYVSANFLPPEDVVRRFLQAVDRGEFKVLGRVFDRGMLVPTQVVYVYDLDCPAPSIKVFSRLAKPLPMPHQPSYTVREVAATLSLDGHIVETEVHVWMGEGEE